MFLKFRNAAIEHREFTRPRTDDERVLASGGRMHHRVDVVNTASQTDHAAIGLLRQRVHQRPPWRVGGSRVPVVAVGGVDNMKLSGWQDSLAGHRQGTLRGMALKVSSGRSVALAQKEKNGEKERA
jgi:hypothetical protein